jgi:uncharacterized membrane protein YhaH (DUF805 family)
MEWYLKVMRQYADFNGRARRKEYWMFVLFNLIFTVAAAIADNLIGFTFGEFGYGFIYLIYVLAVFITGLSVTVRRLHDRGKSGWFYLIALIPLIGAIWLLIVLCQDSEPDNEYGANPKAIDLEFQ